MTAKDLLLHQTYLAFEGDPEMSLKASLQGVTDEIAARVLVDRSWSIEQIVYHVASVKINYCRQGFGRWRGDCEKPWGDFAAMLDLLDRAQAHLVSCLESCAAAQLEQPLATQYHGESAAHFFTVMLMHDISHAGQIRTRQRIFGTRSGDHYPL